MESILLTEDDPFLAEIYYTKLSESGFNVEIAKDGMECLNKIKAKKPDVLVLDIVLPQISGWEVLRRIKKDDSLKDMRVIILSNLGDKREVESGLKLGAIKYLIKARYTPSEVASEIKSVFNK